jgi:hypothetical protein
MLTQEGIRAAIRSQKVWDLGNEVLYRLCREYPDHSEDEAIIAKVWLIGRSYAAAIERRKERGEFSSDAYYCNRVAPMVRQSSIDKWFNVLRNDQTNAHDKNVEAHKHLTDLFSEISGLGKRSLASKYLHFHFPQRFFIYDARASECVRRLRRQLDIRSRPLPRNSASDPIYGVFYDECLELTRVIGQRIGQALSPRGFDKLLLAMYDKNGEAQI